MCLITRRLEPCMHAECQLFYSSFSESRPTLLSTEILQFISGHLNLQESLLSQLASDNQEIEFLLCSVSSQLSKLQSVNLKIAQEDPVCVERMFEYINNSEFAYKVQLNCAFPPEVFKERGFSLSVVVKSHQCAHVTFPGYFKVALFTMDDTPKHLKVNINGRNILRGTTEVLTDTNGVVLFNNVVINEVSSHYFNESFNLVVYHESAYNIQPLVIPSLKVRARTVHK